MEIRKEGTAAQRDKEVKMTLIAKSTATVLNAANELKDTDKGYKDNFTKDKN